MRLFERNMRAPSLAALLFTAGLAVASRAGAQDRAAAVTARGQAVASRLQAETSCLARVQAQVTETLAVVASTVAQTSHGSADARRDAVLALESLEQRLWDLDQAARRCRDDRVVFPGTYRPGTTVQQVPAPPPRTEPVDSVRVLDRDRDLAPGVRVVEATQVDGVGTVLPESLRPALTAAGPRLRACYDSYLERGALVQGELSLVFRVGPSGAVTSVMTEGGTLTARTFRACIERAGRTIRLAGGVRGGDVTIAYGLRFSTE